MDTPTNRVAGRAAGNVSRRSFLRLAGTACLGMVAGSRLGPALGAEGRRPNILFIFSDDHSIQTIGAYGARLSDFCRQQRITPNIDRLAAEGALFPNSFCGNSLCSPSRASILTGLHSHANGVMTLNKPINPGLWTYPVSLREAGYQTAIFGKWHLATTRPETDYWRILPGQGSYLDPKFEGPDGMESHQGYATDIITDMSLDWLKKRDPAKPFMLMVQHKAPHRNWIPPERYYRWLDDVEIPEPDTLFDDYANRASPARLQKMEIGRDMVLKSDLKVEDPDTKVDPDSAYGRRNVDFRRRNPQGRDLTRWKYQQYMKDYLRCIRAVDDSVGRLTQYLRDAGLDGNTVVIYAADQGFYNGEHGWFDKRWIYEESIHMPLIMRWPGVVKAGSRPVAMVQNIDYAPTFVDIAGGRIPAGLHGRSFVPILRGQTPADWRQSVYYHYYDAGHGVAKQYGIRTGRYTLVHFYTTDEWELFDRQKDPKQLRSVYADPAYADTVVELKAELEQLRTRFKDDTMFTPPDRPAAKAKQNKKKKKKAS
jgi:arylsulfatase A-like enzyme